MLSQLAALIAFSSCVVSAADPSSLALVFRDAQPLSSGVDRLFRGETSTGLQATLRDPGLQVLWRTGAAFERGESYERLIVVTFQGDCSLSMGHTRGGRGPLGLTFVSDGHILPFIQIDCSRVKDVLARGEAGRHTLLSPETFARALSHVALHEIYHVISNRKHHDSEGLFKAEYSERDLREPIQVQARAERSLLSLRR